MAMSKYIDYRTPVSSLAFNGQDKGVIPKGIYNGGALSPGAGLAVRVEPFTVKTFDGLTLSEDAWTTVNISSVGTWYIVLQAIYTGLAPVTTTWRVLTVTQFTTDPNKDYFICFGRVTIPIGATVVTSDMISDYASDIIRLDPVYRGHIFSGQSNFNGTTGTQVVHGLGHTDYYVHITPSEAPGLAVGDIYIEKETTLFTVYITGTAVSKFDYILVPQRSFFPAAMTGAKTGKFIFNGTSGVTIGHYTGSAEYHVVVLPYVDDATAIDDIWVEKSSDTFTIKNLGTTGAVGVWMLFPTTNTSLFVRDSSTFNGLTGVEVAHALGHTDYVVSILPSANPVGGLGDVWVVKATNKFTVYNSGSATTAFEYVLIQDVSSFLWGTSNLGSVSGMEQLHMLNTLEYVPIITPVQFVDPIGKISFYRNFNRFNVFNPGIATSQFDWCLISIYSWM